MQRERPVVPNEEDGNGVSGRDRGEIGGQGGGEEVVPERGIGEGAVGGGGEVEVARGNHGGVEGEGARGSRGEGEGEVREE